MDTPFEPEKRSNDKYLFHYTSVETLLDYILSGQTLRLSPMSELNDPKESKFSVSTFFGGKGIDAIRTLQDQWRSFHHSRVKATCFSCDDPSIAIRGGEHMFHGYFQFPKTTRRDVLSYIKPISELKSLRVISTRLFLITSTNFTKKYTLESTGNGRARANIGCLWFPKKVGSNIWITGIQLLAFVPDLICKTGCAMLLLTHVRRKKFHICVCTHNTLPDIIKNQITKELRQSPLKHNQ